MSATDFDVTQESQVLRAIRAYASEIQASLQTHLDHLRDSGYSVSSTVCGLWRVPDLSNSRGAQPVLYVSRGTQFDNEFESDEANAHSALTKAEHSADANHDTLFMMDHPVHWKVCRPSRINGRIVRRAGAIIRRIGRVEFVVSSGGMEHGLLEHKLSETFWDRIETYAAKTEQPATAQAVSVGGL